MERKGQSEGEVKKNVVPSALCLPRTADCVSSWAVFPAGLSGRATAGQSLCAWLTYQGRGIVRKYVSLKECNLFFVLFY